MCESATDIIPGTVYPASLARADALEREITDLCAQINAAGYRLLQLIAELDDQDPWGAWGLNSCAHWLNWRCGIGLNAAREKVRVAHALKDLPVISASFASGQLSFSKVRALTRIADGTNEAELLELALHATAADVEKLVRGYRRAGRLAEREQAMAGHAARELSYYHDDDGCLVIRARLPAEAGAVVLQALEAAMEAQRADESEAVSENVTAVTSEPEKRFAQDRADALTTMAETTLRHGPEPLSPAERYQVVVHVTAETLAASDDGRAELECGQRLAPDTARRIACDASLIRITEDADGNPFDIGRKTRAVPRALQRALRARDGGCRFPGCTHHRLLEAHHIRHWANGGATSLDNLVLLCRRHHHLVHEGGFGVERIDDDVIRFTRPDGSIIAAHPQLPAFGDADLCDTLIRDGKQPIDASDWIIPEAVLNLDLAVSGLIWLEESKTCHFE